MYSDKENKSTNFLKHFAIIGLGTALNIFLGLFTTPLITRIVAPEEYGQFSIFTMYGSIAVMVLCLGFDQSLIRYYYVHESVEYRRSLLSKCIVLPVAICILVSGVFIILTYFGWFNFEFDFIIIILFCLYSAGQLIYRFSLLLVRLSYQSKKFSLLNILQKLLYIIIALPLILWVSDDYLLMLVIAITISTMSCLFLSVIFQKKEWDICHAEKNSCEFTNKELFKYGYPFIISMGIATVFQAADKMSLNYYCTYNEVGIYSSTMTIVNLFAIIQTTFNSLWAPLATEHYINDQEDRSFYQKGNQTITVVMFFCGLSLILFKDIFAILLGERYREAAYILPCLIFHPIMYTISETTVMGISFKKKSKMQIVISLVACVTNIIGNSILVPLLGCQGAAISTGFSYVVFFTMRTVISNRYFYVDFKLKKFYIITFVVFVYALYNMFNEFDIIAVLGYFACVSLLFVLYKNTILWGIQYCISYVRNLLTRKKR